MTTRLPLALPALVLVVVLSVALARPVARAVGTSRVVAGLLLFGVGIVVAFTLTPFVSPLGEATHPGTCDFSRMTLASLQDIKSGQDVAGNILLLLPLGFAVGWLPRSRRSALVLTLAVALPFAVETIQLIVPVLGRACESADVVDNLTGFVLGLAAALVLRVAGRSRRA